MGELHLLQEKQTLLLQLHILLDCYIWFKFNQTLLLLVHILDEIELLLFLVHCVKSWNLLVLTVMEKL